MSQQELMPEPQSSQEAYQKQNRPSWSGTERPAQISSRPWRSKATDLPKSDHPATFEDSLPLYSYPAQDQTLLTQQPYFEQKQQRVQPQDATDAYQPYSQYNGSQQAPHWAQPQEDSTDIFRWIGLALLVLFILMSIPMLCSLGTILVSIIFLFSILPIIITFAPIAFLLLIPLLRVFGSDGDQERSHRRYHQSSSHQSWWW